MTGYARYCRQYGQAEVTIPYTDKKAVDILTRNVSILSVKDKIIYLSLSPVTLNGFFSRSIIIRFQKRAENKGVISALNLNQAMEWDKYPTYTQYDSIMRSFKTLYPELCHLDTIGKSINGKLILALKISDNAATDEDEPEVFYSSSIHGDETGGFVLMLRLADYLLKNYQTDSRVKNLVDNLEIWINPLANPDGTYTTGNIISSPSRYNANGIDLNRNFPDPFTPNTIQEKETIDMMKFLESTDLLFLPIFIQEQKLSIIHGTDGYQKFMLMIHGLTVSAGHMPILCIYIPVRHI